MSQTRTHKTSDSDDDFDVITLCIDQNQFRSNDLVSLIADERFGFLVPEAAIIEMIKSNAWEQTLRSSLRHLSTVPYRVHLGTSMTGCMYAELRSHRPLALWQLLDIEGSKRLQGLLSEVATESFGPEFEWLAKKKADIDRWLRSGHLNHDKNQRVVRGGVEAFLQSLSVETVKRMRRKDLSDTDRMRFVSGAAFGFTQRLLRDAGMADDVAISLSANKCFIARQNWLSTWTFLYWVEYGGSEARLPADSTNDHIDDQIILAGSYVNGLMTRDRRVGDAYSALARALHPDFSWEIDVGIPTDLPRRPDLAEWTKEAIQRPLAGPFKG